MKLKVLVIIFNAVLLTIFFTVLSFSFFTAGTEFIGSFLKNYWIFVLFFTFLFIGMNIFFISNWKLITTLESEDFLSIWKRKFLKSIILPLKKYGCCVKSVFYSEILKY